MADGWAVIETRDGAHVVPVADLVEHVEHACVCGPAMEYVEAVRPGGPSGWLHTHHSLDGREKTEESTHG